MFELIPVSESTFYIQSPAKIGLVLTGPETVCLIDSGNDRDAGKKVRRILDDRGWRLASVFNTHSHADHIGGNRYLQDQTGCSVYAPEIELAFVLHPALEPSFLYGGNPPAQLRHKFLMAQESSARLLTKDVLPEGWELLPLPGHSFNMVGFRTPDDAVFLADCLSGKETLLKYRIPFLVDPAAFLDTLERVKAMKARLFIPSHAEPSEEIASLAQANMDAVHAAADTILDICREPSCFDRILKELFSRFALSMTFEQHALVGSTIRSYLSWLAGQGRIQAEPEGNLLVWRS